MSLIYQVSTIVQVSTITDAPGISVPSFEGWYLFPNGSSYSINCPSTQSLYTTLNYAACCDIDATTCLDLFTACAENTALGAVPLYCGTVASCLTMSIFDQYPINTGAVQSQIMCAAYWSAFSIYRTILEPSTATNYLTVTSTVPTTSTLATSSQSSAYGTTTTSCINNTGDSSSSSSSCSPTPNKAWIAGAVIGPLLAVALIVALIWFLRRRRGGSKSKKLNSAGRGDSPAYAHVQQGGEEHYAKPPLVPANNARYEMEAKDPAAHEMTSVVPNEALEMYSDLPSVGPFELSESQQPSANFR